MGLSLSMLFQETGTAPMHDGQDRKQQPATDRWRTKLVEAQEDLTDCVSTDLALFTIWAESSPPIVVSLKVYGRLLPLKVDTGAAVTIISDKTRKALFANYALTKSSVILKTYTAERMPVVGKLSVPCRKLQWSTSREPSSACGRRRWAKSDGAKLAQAHSSRLDGDRNVFCGKQGRPCRQSPGEVCRNL